MIPLEQIRVAAPCGQSWDGMEGDNRVRFCGTCRRNVYNLSEMSRAEAEALLVRTEGRACVRFYRRTDGTLLTRDCPVGLRALRRRTVAVASWAVGLAVALMTGIVRPGAGTTPGGLPVSPRPCIFSLWDSVRHWAAPPPPTMGAPVAPPLKSVSPARLRPSLASPATRARYRS